MRRMILAGLLTTITAACSASANGPIESRGSFEPPDGARVEIRALIQPEHRRDAPRYMRGAVAGLAAVTVWLGPSPRALMTLLDPPWRAMPAADPGVTVLDRTPWWRTTTSMAPEIAAARAVARSAWHEAIDGAALPPWFTRGLIEYSARRAIVPLFQAENLGPGFAMFEARYFGGFVPWFVRLRLLPEADGDPLTAYRARPRANPSAPAPADELRSLEGKTVLVLETLERWVGTPVLDGALAAFVGASRGRQPTLADFTRIVSAASGQRLSWLLDPAFRESVTFDYAVTTFSSVPAPAGGFDTAVVIARLGDGQFTGSSAPPIEPFESGRGVTLAVSFAGGDRIVDAWDGRAARKVFAYRSSARADSAIVDPDRTLLLDVHRTNNSAMAQPRASSAAARWAARWMVWLQHALLSYAALL